MKTTFLAIGCFVFGMWLVRLGDSCIEDILYPKHPDPWTLSPDLFVRKGHHNPPCQVSPLSAKYGTLLVECDE